MIKKILCKIKIHKYGEWGISPLQALSCYEDDEYDHVKKCERCGSLRHGVFDSSGNRIKK